MAMPAALTRPLDAAADLVKFAVDSGGLDNITVVLVPFPPVDGAEQPTRVGQSDYPTRVD
jgi:serine/threonine protein phosphatase PrpC